MDKLNEQSLPNLKYKGVYASEIKKMTALILSFDEDKPGFHRNYFAKSVARSKGTKSLLKLELPSTWDKYLAEKDIDANLARVFRAHDLKTHGDPPARDLLNQWK